MSMANLRQFNNNEEVKTANPAIAARVKQESSTIIKLCPEISVVYDAVVALISQKSLRYPTSATKNQLANLLQHQSPQSSNMFLRGLEAVETSQRAAFILKWSHFLENLQNHFPKLARRVHDYFLKKYSWHELNSDAFFNLIEKLAKKTPAIKRIRSWFNKYFQPIDSNTQKLELEKAIAKFTQFYDLCDKYNVYPYLAKPPKSLISFQLKEDDYIEKCNFVLEKNEIAEGKSFENASHRQAELLDQLPNSRLTKQAFTQGYTLVCNKMMLHDNLPAIPSKEELDRTPSYATFRSRAIAFLATDKKLSLKKPITFFELMDKIPEKKLNAAEKLILSKAFVEYYLSEPMIDMKCFITYSQELKTIFGSVYLERILDTPITEYSSIDYLKACQSLIELKDKFDIDALFNRHLPNIKNLNLELERIKLRLTRNKFPEVKVETVLNKFRNTSEFVKFPLSNAEVTQLGEDYKEILEYGAVCQTAPMSELSAAARKLGQKLKQNPGKRDASLELIAIIREVVNRVFQINPHSTQILTLLSLIRVPAGKKGRIAQKKTGEGKSLVDAMLAVYHGCQDKFVDIITSSSNLAIRDQKKYAKFFNVFGISSSHICHRRPERQHFNGQILYGTNRDFEFSILRDELYNREHRYTTLNGKLCKRTCDVAIVDEVDNLFLDTALSSARIATASPQARPWVYAPILSYANQKLDAKENIPLSEHVQRIRQILKESYDAKYAEQVNQIPDKKILQWLSSAKSSLEDKKLNRDYVILTKEKTRGENEKDIQQVVIVDYKNTGRLNPGSRWQHGLHEFVETKEGIEPQSESLTSASMSHPAFFNSYKEIYGLSGTVGEEIERKEIETVYNLDTFDVPPHARSQRYSLPPQILDSEEQHFVSILEDIQNHILEKRPILVLFDSIEKANKFSAFLADKNIKFQLLDDKQKEDEEYLVSRAGRPGMVTIATNTAGRGTDIGLTIETAIAGGLHVILAFYPANVRVEEQGLGRAGRQGQPGTCRLILQSDDEQISELVPRALREVMLRNKIDFMNNLRKLRTLRVARESRQRISRIKIDTIQHNVLKEFCNLLKYARKKMTKIEDADLVKQLSHVTIPPADIKESSNPAIQFIQKQVYNHIAQQINDIPVNWQAFLKTAKQLYFEMILQEWATFYDHLSDEETNLDPELYKIATFKKFHTFMTTHLAQFLENPERGFYHWLSNLTGATLELPSQNKTAFYEKWLNQIKNVFEPTPIEYKKMDYDIHLHQPESATGFIQYELKTLNYPITKIVELDMKENDLTLFTAALEQGDLNKIKQLLLETRIDIKTITINGDPPLIVAAKKGYLDIVEWLLKTNNASITDKSPNGSTAVLWAAECGHLPVVKWLLEEGGASIDDKTIEAKKTILLCAAQGKQLHVMQWLIENGISSVHESDKYKSTYTALIYAARNGDVPSVQWLLEEGGVTHDEICVALSSAASYNHPDVAKLLIEHGATLTSDLLGNTPLHQACVLGNLRIVELIYKHLSKMNIPDLRNNNWDTPLIFAAAGGHLPLVKWLLKNGSTIKERNIFTMTPLIAAAKNGALSVVQWFLKFGGASLNEKDINGDTVLIHAINRNQLHVVKWLLENGANVNDKNKKGEMPVYFAETIEMQLLLQEYIQLEKSKPKASLTQFSILKQKNVAEQEIFATPYFTA